MNKTSYFFSDICPEIKKQYTLKEVSKKKVIVLKKKASQPDIPPATDDLIRLNRFISNSGVCSRRDADKLITDGKVTVNGEVVTELGRKVSLDDEVRFEGKQLNPERKVYLLLNKPKGFATTVDDPHVERTVMQLVETACKERIYPVGRLDMQTTGLLLFTNDGDLAKKLTHPSYEREKVYHVQLDKDIFQEDLDKIKQGFELEDGFIAADDIQLIDPHDKRQVGIEIHSGKNRIVRRIFNHLGYQVEKLDRVAFAGLTKKDLPRGRYRFLTQQEISFLKMS
jgi:23S rRNA pseudouridine2605 synthase